ncbi:hypothetical protein [Streptomyces sp. NPDC085659]|uniref:hypothetical protein n=1 Tax=Streptomyces sp. NPDC085659 TaxID=3155177 RepID=UPI00344ECA19
MAVTRGAARKHGAKEGRHDKIATYTLVRRGDGTEQVVAAALREEDGPTTVPGRVNRLLALLTTRLLPRRRTLALLAGPGPERTAAG